VATPLNLPQMSQRDQTHGLSGQKPVNVLSHACSFKTGKRELHLKVQSVPPSKHSVVNTRDFILYINISSSAAFRQIYVACVVHIFSICLFIFRSFMNTSKQWLAQID